MFRRNKGRIGAVTVILAIVFTVGLILGTVALFYVPEDIVKETKEAFKITENIAFGKMFKENLMFELVWMLSVWLMGSNGITAPFTGAVISVRGFVIGFSIAFVLAGGFDMTRFFLCSILPQCITALPVMSVFVLMCILYASERKYKDSSSAGYFLRGVLFMGITTIATVGETALMILFGKCL